MPILNIRIEAKNRHGDPIPIPPGVRLRELGPRVQITLSPLEAQRKSIADKGEPLPTPVVGLALIDTRASSTCIDQKAAQKAGLAIVDSGPMTSVTHDNEVVPIYAGQLKVEGISQYVDVSRAYGVKLESQGLIALIGRDMLASCMLIYNGTDGSFSLSL